MSIVMSLLGKLGIINSPLPKIHQFKLSLVNIRGLRIGSKDWPSQAADEEFRTHETLRRSVNESLAKLPVAR